VRTRGLCAAVDQDIEEVCVATHGRRPIEIVVVPRPKMGFAGSLNPSARQLSSLSSYSQSGHSGSSAQRINSIGAMNDAVIPVRDVRTGPTIEVSAGHTPAPRGPDMHRSHGFVDQRVRVEECPRCAGQTMRPALID
jgi:hypothetical protein